jgi:D-beta-D-heptose 7-phosphate kinase/D-beta-D-heptose 1-phosphate adenosyltransferase
MIKLASPSKINWLRDQGYEIVFTNGCFDVLHIGHIRVLEECRQIAYNITNQSNALHPAIVVVGINSDESVKALKGPDRPFNPQYYRTEFLNSIEYVDRIVVFKETTVLPLIELIKPTVLVKGGSSDEIVGEEFVQSYGGQVIKTEPVPGLSTTSIMEKVS